MRLDQIPLPAPFLPVWGHGWGHNHVTFGRRLSWVNIRPSTAPPSPRCPLHFSFTLASVVAGNTFLQTNGGCWQRPPGNRACKGRLTQSAPSPSGHGRGHREGGQEVEVSWSHPPQRPLTRVNEDPELGLIRRRPLLGAADRQTNQLFLHKGKD